MSQITYRKIFEPLQKHYNWDIIICDLIITGSKEVEKQIETEEPILREIKATIESHITYLNKINSLIQVELNDD